MSRQALSLLCLALLLVLGAIEPQLAHAYDQYSVNKDETNCAACHGDYRASPYTSLSDGQSWGSDLMDIHSSLMLNGDCTTCHGSGPRFPVLTNSSAGGTGLDPISCSGCHGRAEDGTGNGTERYGAGLRQHHWVADRMINGISTRICLDCHTDADPANYTPVDEDVLPPYYSSSDAAHPLIPSDPCNLPADGFPEHYAATTEGLDNDGDGLYDELDLVACPEPAEIALLLSGMGLLLMLDRRRRRR